MTETVARHLVPASHDSLHKLWMTLRHPAQSEERGLGAVIGEHLQDGIDISLDTAGIVAPAVAWNGRIEGRDLIVVFDIHGHRVRDRFAGTCGWRHTLPWRRTPARLRLGFLRRPYGCFLRHLSLLRGVAPICLPGPTAKIQNDRVP